MSYKNFNSGDESVSVNPATNLNTPTPSVVIRRPNKFGNTKAGVGEFTGPQTRTVSENNPSRAELAKSFDENYLRNTTQAQITVSGKYSEVNYVTFNIPNLQSVRSISGNIYSGVIKKVISNPIVTDSLDDKPTMESIILQLIAGGTSGTSGVIAPQFPPFGVAGVVGEIREFLPTGEFYIFTFNYNIGSWIPYIVAINETGQGTTSTSGGGGTLVGLDQSGGGGPVDRPVNLGGGTITSGGGNPPGGDGGSFIGGL